MIIGNPFGDQVLRKGKDIGLDHDDAELDQKTNEVFVIGVGNLVQRVLFV